MTKCGIIRLYQELLTNMSKSHDEPVDPVWAAFAKAEEQEAAKIKRAYQEIEDWNDYILNRILANENNNPYPSNAPWNLEEQISRTPIGLEATLYLQPDRRQELINMGMCAEKAELEGGPFTICGEVVPDLTEVLIENLIRRTGAVQDWSCNVPGAEIWKATFEDKTIEFIFQNLPILLDKEKDSGKNTMLSLYARLPLSPPREETLADARSIVIESPKATDKLKDIASKCKNWLGKIL
jgi:hypothetical protein